MRTIIAGSRSIKDYETVERGVRLSGFDITEVVSGAATGVDKLGERWARENDVPVNSQLALWNQQGLAAGHIRNTEMAEYADGVIIIWDGKSKGTKDMINIARKMQLSIHVHVKGSLEELF